jgi:hypothetical protein
MSMPQIETHANSRFLNEYFVETVEVKTQMRYHDNNDSLSEWEAARLMSKTWSMEQD